MRFVCCVCLFTFFGCWKKKNDTDWLAWVKDWMSKCHLYSWVWLCSNVKRVKKICVPICNVRKHEKKSLLHNIHIASSLFSYTYMYVKFKKPVGIMGHIFPLSKLRKVPSASEMLFSKVTNFAFTTVVGFGRVFWYLLLYRVCNTVRDFLCSKESFFFNDKFEFEYIYTVSFFYYYYSFVIYGSRCT